MYYYIQSSKFFHVVDLKSFACEGGRLFIYGFTKLFLLITFVYRFFYLSLPRITNGFNEQNPLRVISDRKAKD